MNLPENLFYTKEHEWIKVQENQGIIGITDFAQSELGDIVFVELPKVGAKISIGQTFGTIEAVKAVSDLYAPVSGEVVEINNEISNSPQFVNSDPYEKGWMIKVKLSDQTEINSLLKVEDYKQLIGK